MPTLVDDEENTLLRTRTEDELWDDAWKETWLALSAQGEKDGTPVDEKKAFEVAQGLWGTWMLKRKKLLEEDGGEPSLPVNDGMSSPKARKDRSFGVLGGGIDLRSPEPLSAMSGLRAEAPEFTPVVTGERSMFQSFFSPDLLEGGLAKNPSSFTMNPNLSALLQNAPGPPAVRAMPVLGGKKGLLGDGAEYFRLEPGAEQAALQAAQDLANEQKEATTQGWLPNGFAWVELGEDETPPPPAYFEMQLPQTRSFVKSGSKAQKMVRVDNVSADASPARLQELFSQFGPVLEFYATGQAKNQNACRLFIGFETEVIAAACRKALHMKTHQLAVATVEVEYGKLEPKTKQQKEKRERRRGGKERGDTRGPEEEMPWPAMLPYSFAGGMQPYGAGSAFPDLALSFMPHPVFPEAPPA